MRAKLITKPLAEQRVRPNLLDLARERSTFSWNQVRTELLGGTSDEVNIARLAVDRHADGALADRTALRFVAADGSARNLSYQGLRDATNRFANALAGLGVKPGARVFVLTQRSEPLYVAVLGALKAGCVVTPLFAAFGPEPIATRMRIGEAKVLLTTEALYRRKIEPQRAALPSLEHVIVVGDDAATLPAPTAPSATASATAAASPASPNRGIDYASWLAAASPSTPTVRTQASDAALLHFTSGTTGTPKGALHVHEAVLTHFATGRYALDLHDDDIYWCTADPGWVTGTSYGIVAPLLHGVTSIVDEGEFDAQRWYRVLQQ